MRLRKIVTCGSNIHCKAMKFLCLRRVCRQPLPRGSADGVCRRRYFVTRQSNQNEGAQPLLTMSHHVGSLSSTKSASTPHSPRHITYCFTYPHPLHQSYPPLPIREMTTAKKKVTGYACQPVEPKSYGNKRGGMSSVSDVIPPD